MTDYEKISLLVNFLIAAGTIGAVISALYLASRNSKELKKEDCSVEAEYVSFSSAYGYMTGQPRLELSLSALQVCVYNHGFRDLYIQSLSIGNWNSFFPFECDIFPTNDIKVVPGYRHAIHIEFKNLIENPRFLRFYQRTCKDKKTIICVETVFKNKFYAIVQHEDLRFIDAYIERPTASSRFTTTPENLPPQG